MAKANSNETNGNMFYQKHFHKIIVGLMICIFLIILLVIILLVQVYHRPEPPFMAASNDGRKMHLVAFNDPNLLPSTLIRWASKAAVAAYTYDFYNYQKELDAVRPYFTEEGWAGYNNSIKGVINTISANKLFVNGVVSAPPVISNQGRLDKYDRVWRIQIPFLVTYQSAETTQTANYMVTLMIVKVPTTENPAGIAINQFVMR